MYISTDLKDLIKKEKVFAIEMYKQKNNKFVCYINKKYSEPLSVDVFNLKLLKKVKEEI